MNERKQKKAEKVYTYIRELWVKERGIPTHRQIAKACGISLGRVQDYLSLLEAQGRIVRKPYASRGIRLADPEGEVRTDENAETVYEYLKEQLPQGDIPTQDNIADACYLSRGAVRQALIWLEGQGRLVYGEGQRDMRLVDVPQNVQQNERQN
ncbi:MAG: FaeA/PapI family transcriptional regulator [Chloroflexota bacterium]